jgi:Protein of unknown function (DUF732)
MADRGPANETPPPAEIVRNLLIDAPDILGAEALEWCVRQGLREALMPPESLDDAPRTMRPSAAPATDSPAARTYSAVARGYYGQGMLSRVLFGVALAAMSVLQPPRAGADPDNDFLSQLNWYGIDLSDLMGRTITPQKAIEFGHLICDDLRHGTQPKAEMNVFYRAMPKITDKQADNLMSAAQLTICPDTL